MDDRWTPGEGATPPSPRGQDPEQDAPGERTEDGEPEGSGESRRGSPYVIPTGSAAKPTDGLFNPSDRPYATPDAHQDHDDSPQEPAAPSGGDADRPYSPAPGAPADIDQDEPATISYGDAYSAYGDPPARPYQQDTRNDDAPWGGAAYGTGTDSDQDEPATISYGEAGRTPHDTAPSWHGSAREDTGYGAGTGTGPEQDEPVTISYGDAYSAYGDPPARPYQQDDRSDDAPWGGAAYGTGSGSGTGPGQDEPATISYGDAGRTHDAPPSWQSSAYDGAEGAAPSAPSESAASPYRDAPASGTPYGAPAPWEAQSAGSYGADADQGRGAASTTGGSGRWDEASTSSYQGAAAAAGPGTSGYLRDDAWDRQADPVYGGGPGSAASSGYGDPAQGYTDHASGDARSYLDEAANPAFPSPSGPAGAAPAGTPPFGTPGVQAFGSESSGGPHTASAPYGERPDDGRRGHDRDAGMYAGPGGSNRPPGPGGPGGPSGPQDPYAAFAPRDDDGFAERERRKSRKGLWIGMAAVVLVLALAGGVTGWFLLGRGPGPGEVAASWASAWSEQDYAGMAALSTGGDVEEVVGGIGENLGVEKAAIEVGDAAEGEDGTATAPFTATLSLSNAGDWTYESNLSMVQEEGDWKVEVTPATVHPELSEGTTLVRGNVWGERGKILAADGSRLDTEEASGSVQMMTGQVGTAAAEDLEDLGPAYKEGDPTGKGGIQQQYEKRLAGEVSTSVRVAEVGSEEEAAADPDAPVVETIEGEPGQDVTTAIDPGIQSAAASAVTTEGKPTALVAIRPSTGEIVASANNAAGFNRAFEGQYAPGSSFKIVSYESLLENGLATSDTMQCPKEALGFKNAGDAEYGAQSVTEAFATSCNTALVSEVVNQLDGASLTATAELFGMNADLNVGVPTRKPSFPTPDGSGLLAAQSIGQGQILTTPLHMATVPAAIADGSWRSPALVTEPALEDKPEPAAIPQAEALRPMMRAVVTDGTAKDSGFEGEVYGKTGSAEFGTAENEDDELDTHAWTVGYKGDLAFAVVVEGGGGGGSVAGPVGAAFANAF